MQPFPLLAVSNAPFPHAVQDGWLEPDLYDALVKSFPQCHPNSGPTGFTAFWGDADYDALLAGNAAWRTLFDTFHSQAFVSYLIAQFAPTFEEESRYDLARARYVPYVEDRHDKEAAHLREVVHAPDELWIRMDIMQGRIGYDRGRHLDHRRRAATALLYFCDSDEAGLVGGNLRLHEPDGRIVDEIEPRHNRIAMFPCSNSSWHSVVPITSQRAPRNFVQVTLSSSVDLWAPLPRASLLRRGVGAVSRLLA